MTVVEIVCAISAVAWLYLVFWHGGFYQTDRRLPPVDGADEPDRWPAVAAVVPARNEAQSLPETLPGLLAQDYPGDFRVYLVDDNSDDGTGAVAAAIGESAAAGGGAPLTVVPGRPRPDGWAGKVWAMAQGRAAAIKAAAKAAAAEKAATGTAGTGGPAPEFLLFTDADIAWAPNALRDLVRGAVADDRALVSQMAMLRAETGWERLIVPAFVYFFAQLYPFSKVNDPGSGTAAAAGGCMLIRASALKKAGGVAAIKGALIDDVAMGKLLKRAGYRTWLGLATDIRSVRPYPDLGSLWRMVARSAYVQLRYNPLLLAGTLLGLLMLYVVPLAGIIAELAVVIPTGKIPRWGPVPGTGLVSWVLMTGSFVPMLGFYGLSRFRALTLPLVAVLYGAMTFDSARRHYSGRSVSWRGRTADRVEAG